jgi:gamma-glutamyl-gamma-aminobutyrate hydrolase PuuD
MRTLLVTQRVAIIADYFERRDCLDQAWARFIVQCGLLPLPLPNVTEVALALCRSLDAAGILLTGGNDLVTLGGEAPERDAVENALLDLAEQRRLPVLGVCRGMQMIQQRFQIQLHPVGGHIMRTQVIAVEGDRREVNSYHRFGAFESKPPLDAWAVADDGIVKAVRHRSLPLTGIMWHPERFSVPAAQDIALFRRVFGVP